MNQHPQVDTGLKPCGLGVGREGHVFRACHSEQEAWLLILERGQTGTQNLYWVCFPSPGGPWRASQTLNLLHSMRRKGTSWHHW